ncbi:hypothetical protein [Hyphomonas sp.]|uniref:hypothetical protein n=1 Tax=Hyphomonas sp. TaxID=87 RepID=UPI0025C28AEA|nr:hypothetical protein [Hyphomonas sp.]
MNKLFVFASFILASCASGAALVPEAEKGAVIFVMKDEGNWTANVTASRADSENQRFVLDQNGISMYIGKAPLVWAQPSARASSAQGGRIVANFQLVPPGEYVFVSIYDDESKAAGCFSSHSKLFDVQAGAATIVALPDGENYKKAGRSGWKFSPNVTDSELLQLYEDDFANIFGLELPGRVSDTISVSFEPGDHWSALACLAPKDAHFQRIEPK